MINKTVYYNKEKAVVLDEDRDHVLIEFENGTKLCTTKSYFKDEDIKER